ncbi:pyruvate dehydrogenase complex dihydrolipoamide acetyltransferase [Fulvivirgaceae bacterium LMO-SS25]
MAEVIRMPKMSDTMEEGVIAAWLKKEGDKVSAGDILAEVETDKATMELEAFEDGVLLHIGIKDGESVPVDGVIAIIGKKGENIDDLLKDLENESDTKVSAEDKKEDKAEKEDKKNEDNGSEEEIDVSAINATVITMPKMSDTMQEGTIAAWLKKKGDKISSGDVIAEVETDKATMELEAFEDGELLYIGVEEGDSVPVDAVIAIVGEKGADVETLLKAHKNKKSESSDSNEMGEKSENSEAKSSTPKAEAVSVSKEEKAGGSDGERIFVSPLARKMAEEKGYDLNKIKGSGENGRIVKKDIEEYTPQAEAKASESKAASKKEESAPTWVASPIAPGEEKYEEVNVSQMRKAIAKRLAESKYTAPHFYLTMEIDMDKAIAARQSINELSPVKVSFNDMVIKAAAAALRQHPKVNASWRGDKIRFNQHIHIGVAVAVEEGLLVPVVRFADQKSLSSIASEVKELGGKAKNKQLQPADWEGNTFTISNLGMFGIEEFTAIINPPDACIMAVGAIKKVPVVRNDELTIGNVMKVTLSCDHRAVDGAVGSAFLQTFKYLLEDPVRILI